MPLLNNFNALGAASSVGRAGLVTGRGMGMIGSLRAIKWGSVLTNTQKTLNLVNQAIPIYHQAKPVFSNIKTARKILNVINDPSDSSDSSPAAPSSSNQIETKDEQNNNSNNPRFFYENN